MRLSICFCLLFSLCANQLFAQVQKQMQPSLLPYVNTFIGTVPSTTKAAVKHGNGTERFANTFPAVTRPFAMTQFVAQTRTTEQKCLSPFYFNDTMLSGFRASHWISGSCMQDYGSVTIMPITGKLVTSVDQYKTAYSHNGEVAEPSYYKVTLPKYNLTTEMTSTLRCGLFQVTANTDDSLYILVTPNSDRGEGFVKVDALAGEIVGYNPAHRLYQGNGKPAGFSGYFVIKFEQPFTTKGTFKGSVVSALDSIGKNFSIGGFVGFKQKKGSIVRFKAGTSFTSIEGARKNLEAELPGWDIEPVRKAAAAEWEAALNTVQIEGSKKEKQIFYTAIYHTLTHPRLFNDVDGSYPRFATSYKVEKLAKGAYYDDYSVWDAYRSAFPFYQLLFPSAMNDFVQSNILKGQQFGWLPIMACWNNETQEMIGDHVGVLITSAYNKGLRGFDVTEAYRLMRKNAFEQAAPADYRQGKGRRALNNYVKYGYVPLEDSVLDAFHKMEQVSRTIEYAYDDYCVALLAKKLGHEDDYQTLIKRSRSYRNVFDKNVGFSNGRYADGSWYKNFNPDKKHSFITEGTSRQYTFYAPHDVYGLASEMGGLNKLEQALDDIFQKNEYWHGNEPGHQIPFMYNYTPASYKTQKAVRNIMNEEYDEGTGGLSGNDDAGQMSAWYLFAAMGFYPSDPAAETYDLCSPLFSSALNLPNGKQFKLVVKKKGEDDIYIQSLRLNGKPYTKNYITHTDITNGGTLEFTLGAKPNKSFAQSPQDRPAGLSK